MRPPPGSGRRGIGRLELSDRPGTDSREIRAARLGFAPRVQATTRDGRPYTASGIVLPWFVGDNLVWSGSPARGSEAEVCRVYRDWDRPPTIYPSPATIRPGRPLVVVEGEFDGLLLDQALGERAAVVTLGSAMRQARGRHRLAPNHRQALVRRPGRRHGRGPIRGSVERVPSGALSPAPRGAKDWTELHMQGWNAIRYHWLPLLGWVRPSWDDLATERWGPALTDYPSPEDYASVEREAIQHENEI